MLATDNERTLHPPDAAQLDAVIQKVMPFAAIADAFARRSVGKVRTLAMLGLLAGGWLTFATATYFSWSLTTVLFALPLLALPGALLWAMQRKLAATVGLPQRIRDTALGMVGKAAEYRERFAKKHPLDPTVERSGLRQLWRAGKVVLELKSLGDEAQEILSVSAGALMIANPLFLIVLSCAMAAVFVLIGAGGLIALAYLV